MKHVLALVATVALAALAISMAQAGETPTKGKKEQTIEVTERTTAVEFIDVGPADDSLGDYVVIASELFNPANERIGTSHEVCVRVVVGQLRQCNLTYFFAEGFLTLQGPYRDDGTGTFAITGGTGIYRTARGYMELTETRTADGLTFEYTEIFHVIGVRKK
jgi:allene oxide cyclase-like protein